MLRLDKKFCLLVAVVLLASPLTALAGAPGTITFAPGGAGSGVAIPTMGAMGLILMSLVLAAIAVQHIRSQGGIGSFFVGLILVGAIASATGGVKLIQVAKAFEFSITNPSGQSFEFGEGSHLFTNDSGVKQKVTEIDLDNCRFGPDEPSSASKVVSTMCDLGTGLSDGASCEIQCGNEPQ